MITIEAGKSYILVHLRPEPGKPAPDPVAVKASYITDAPQKIKIGQSGELIVSREKVETVRRSSFLCDAIIKVFAPHAWLYYEVVTETSEL